MKNIWNFKNVLFLSAALTAAVLAGTLSSCDGNDPIVPENPEKPKPEEPKTTIDSVYHNIVDMKYLSDNIQVMEAMANDTLKLLFITVGKLEPLGSQFDLIARLFKFNTDATRLASPDWWKSLAIAPAAAGTLLTFTEWERMGFPPITTGAGGKFLVRPEEMQLFLASGADPDQVDLKLPDGAEILKIGGPEDFAEKAAEIEKVLAQNRKAVVQLDQNIVVTDAIMEVLKNISHPDVSWWGAGAFIPCRANQSAIGKVLKYLPFATDKNGSSFFVSGADGATELDGIAIIPGKTARTDTMSLCRTPNVLLARDKIFADVFPFDLRNLSGYIGERGQIQMVVPDGKIFEVTDANVRLLGMFQTRAIREAYNFGYSGNPDEECGWYGLNGPIQLRDPNGKFLDIGIKSMNYDARTDTIFEAGHWIFPDGKELDISNSVLNMLEASYFMGCVPEFTIMGNRINIVWTHLPYVMKDGSSKQKIASTDFYKFLSENLFKLKARDATVTITDEWFSAYDGEFAEYFTHRQPQPETAQEYMLGKYNIILNVSVILQALPMAECETMGFPIRIPGGWTGKNSHAAPPMPQYKANRIKAR